MAGHCPTGRSGGVAEGLGLGRRDPLLWSDLLSPPRPSPIPAAAASGNCSGAGRARPLPVSLAHSLCDLENQRT